MCTGLEAAALGAAAGGTILGGRSQKRQADEAAAARLAEAKSRARAIRKARGETMAQATVAQAASGVSVTDGGTVDVVQREIAANAERDALMELLSGERDARALRRAGKDAMRASVLNAASLGFDAAAGWKRAAKGTS